MYEAGHTVKPRISRTRPIVELSLHNKCEGKTLSWKMRRLAHFMKTNPILSMSFMALSALVIQTMLWVVASCNLYYINCLVVSFTYCLVTASVVKGGRNWFWILQCLLGIDRPVHLPPFGIASQSSVGVEVGDSYHVVDKYLNCDHFRNL